VGGTGQRRWAQFDLPSGIAVAADGSVYVADSWNRIQKFSSNGKFIRKWGRYGSGDGQFWYPYGIAVAPDGSVYVADKNNHRIQKFDSDGRFILKWGKRGSGDGRFDDPIGIAVAADGAVYVADLRNHRIQKFSSDGKFIRKWGEQGSGDGQFDYPSGIALALDGSVYVADNHRVQKFVQEPYRITGRKVSLRGKIDIVGSNSTYPKELMKYLNVNIDGEDNAGETFYGTTSPNRRGKYKFKPFPADASYRITIDCDPSIFKVSPSKVSGKATKNTRLRSFELEQLAFQVSGTIKDRSGQSVSSVTVSGGLLAVKTNNDGGFTTYVKKNTKATIEPSKDGYRFEPSKRVVRVKQKAITGIDFTAIVVLLLESIDPDSIKSDVFVSMEADITLRGEGFQIGMTVSSNSLDLTFSDVRVNSSEEATVHVKVKQNPTKGAFDITETVDQCPAASCSRDSVSVS